MNGLVAALHVRRDEQEQAEKLVNQINELLGYRKGFNINLREDCDGLVMYVHADEARAKESQSRNAGRKLSKEPKKVTCGEVDEMLKTMKNEAVAEKLGYSRATYFRKLKVMREHGDMDSLF